jgi:hypothetical protein
MSSINKYEMCFCGSGKTYKFCHHRYDQRRDSMMTKSLSLRKFSDTSKMMISEFVKEGGFGREGDVNHFEIGSEFPKYFSKYFSEEIVLRKLGVLVVFSVSPDGEGVELFKIEVTNEGKGVGTQIMELLISLSEKYGVEVVLTPNPWKSKKSHDYYNKMVKLSKWYGRLGFQFVENSVYMRYSPKSVEYNLVG